MTTKTVAQTLYQKLGWDSGHKGERRRGMVIVIQQAANWIAECTACSRIGQGGTPAMAYMGVDHRAGCSHPERFG